MRRLDNKVAIISGCGRGFGKVIAQVFAEEGAAVSICDIIPLEKLKEELGSTIEASGGKVSCFQADVSKENEVRAMVMKTIEQFGTIDILVNNVGIAGPTKDCWQITLEEWNKTLSVNLGGTFLCTKHVLSEMIQKKYGRIINIGSISGKLPLPHRTPYTTSKMGIIGFTRSLAAEVGRYNITVNVICPGSPEGERNVELSRALATYLGKPFNADEYRNQVAELKKGSRTVLAGNYLRNEGFHQTMIDHKDVASIALFLASDEANKITGQDINVCGGWVMW